MASERRERGGNRRSPEIETGRERDPKRERERESESDVELGIVGFMCGVGPCTSCSETHKRSRTQRIEHTASSSSRETGDYTLAGCCKLVFFSSFSVLRRESEHSVVIL